MNEQALPLLAGFDPVHLHLITNHIPIFLTLGGIIALALAFTVRCGNAKRIALVLLLLGTVGGLVTYWLGQEAYKPVRGIADALGQDLLDTHMERAESMIWLFWLASASSLVALLPFFKNVRVKNVLAAAAWVLALATLAAAGWIADAGGKIRHSEIRGNETTQPSELMPHEH